MTKEEFRNQIIDGIKAGRLDPCNSVEFRDIYTSLPQYYWTVEECGVDDWYDQYQEEA